MTVTTRDQLSALLQKFDDAYEEFYDVMTEIERATRKNTDMDVLLGFSVDVLLGRIQSRVYRAIQEAGEALR